MEAKRQMYATLLLVLGLLLVFFWFEDSRKLASNQKAPAAHSTQASRPLGLPVPMNSEGRSPADRASASSDTLLSQKAQSSLMTDVLRLTLQDDGTMYDADLLGYAKKQGTLGVVRLLDRDPARFYEAWFKIADEQSQVLSFQPSDRSLALGQGQSNLIWSGTSNVGQGLKLEKQYVLDRGEYTLEVRIKAVNTSDTDRKLMLHTGISRAIEKKQGLGLQTFEGVAYSNREKPYQKISPQDVVQTPFEKVQSSGWTAMLQQYFITAWIPPQDFDYLLTSSSSESKTSVETRGFLEVPAHQEIERSYHFYIGPAIAEKLKKAAPHLEMTIDYGMFWMISTGLFWLLKKIYSLVQNWGWSIVLLTTMIRLAFYKLSEKSYRSIAKMKELQPKILALKERYSGDQKKLLLETTALYKKHGVSPAGGCLPQIVQIPVFIALYWVLVESVELRMAPFVGWIQDLSLKDPYYVLPILMGLSMLIQQKMSPQSSDPVQQKIFGMMPLVFTFFFMNFPSGLVLYWLVNNVLTVAQQFWMLQSAKVDHDGDVS